MMDWSAVALQLAERASIPAVLLSPQGEVLLVTAAAERALGWSYDSVGSSWIDRFVVHAAAAAARWFLEKTLSGAVRRFEIEILTPNGPATASFESYPVGSNEGRGVLLLLEKVVTSRQNSPTADYDYEVGGSFALAALWALGAERRKETGKCYVVLHGRSSPCEPCPLRMPERDSSARAVVHPGAGVGQYQLTTASSTSAETARISVRHLSMASFSTILNAKLDELSERAQLSKRERDVLGHLIYGHPLEEIASTLGISQRTVKFHQTNLLQKLGADSRSDLMRLVLWH
ncbi:MAG TPA: helix-turn-helix transcriptional regulator [Polyangiaceae bacterium]|jgi:DNA-binding CsgD family transcriptional regulator|nr:helix-turn-helix transcriptional regulator [Polyangiaceae bacterium]